jgi:hypothetical protein
VEEVAVMRYQTGDLVHVREGAFACGIDLGGKTLEVAFTYGPDVVVLTHNGGHHALDVNAVRQ